MLTAQHDAFISYSHRDADWVKDWLLPHLESEGFLVCIDFRDFKVGESSLDNMARAAAHCRKTIFVMTPNWTVSEFSQFESIVGQTFDPIGRQGRLVPLMLKDCDLPARLQILTYADFRNPNNWETELGRVIDAIREPTITRLTAQPTARFSPDLVHPYPLQSNFTGRDRERNQLSSWLASDERPICELVAMGGMGKSSLTWYWLTHNVLPSLDVRLDGVLWWSFYEGESSFSEFIDETLKYASGQTIDAKLLPTTYDRAQALREILLRKRVLVVLDGFERQLRAYGSLDAAYQRDDKTNESQEARSCMDPITSRWLRDLAAGVTRVKVLLTTRLGVRDLEDNAGEALAGVLRLELEELSCGDVIAFMRAQGVTKGTAAEITNVSATYGNHPLSLRLLSGLIARDVRTPGDIAAAPRHDVHEDLVQRRHHILEQSYNALPQSERTTMSRIAAFRSSMPFESLVVFNEYVNETAFEASLDDLRMRGLLQRDLTHNRYDLHPIVRHYCYDRLTDKTGVHTRLVNYFAKVPVPELNKVQSLEDLAPIIELYHHTVRAGQYDEAWRLFRLRLRDLLYYRFGSYGTCLELILPLLTQGEAGSPRLIVRTNQGGALSTLAASYGLSGQLRNAISAYQAATPLFEKLDERLALAQNLTGLATIGYMQLGNLGEAHRNLTHAIILSREMKDEVTEAIGRQEFGHLLMYRGVFDDMTLELNAAMALFEKHQSKQSMCVVWLRRSHGALLRGDLTAAVEAAQRAVELTQEFARTTHPINRDLIAANWLLGAALTTEGQHLAVAAEKLSEALNGCRRTNLVELEPDILLAWAKWHRRKGNAQESLAYVDAARIIADRCEYRLKQAEIHNFLAQLAFDSHNHDEARTEARIAATLALCDDRKYSYRPAFKKARNILKLVRVKQLDHERIA